MSLPQSPAQGLAQVVRGEIGQRVRLDDAGQRRPYLGVQRCKVGVGGQEKQETIAAVLIQVSQPGAQLDSGIKGQMLQVVQ